MMPGRLRVEILWYSIAVDSYKVLLLMLTVNSLHCFTEVVRGGEAGGAAAGLLPTTELRCLSLLGMIQ